MYVCIITFSNYALPNLALVQVLGNFRLPEKFLFQQVITSNQVPASLVHNAAQIIYLKLGKLYNML